MGARVASIPSTYSNKMPIKCHEQPSDMCPKEYKKGLLESAINIVTELLNVVRV